MDPHRRLAVSLARRAVELDPTDSGARWALGFVLLYEREWEHAASEFELSFRLNPNDADAWALSTDFKVFEGHGAAGIDCVQKALRLNPHPPGWYYWVLGEAQYAAEEYAAAVESLRAEDTYRTGSRRILAAALAMLGRADEAREEARQPFRDLAARDRFVEGYRKAGLPE